MAVLLAPALTLAQGPGDAAFARGVAAYEQGDFLAAYEAWLPLARQDDAAAQRNLGQLFRLGQGVQQDFAEAAKWYGRAAELGLPSAQANLAALYLNGQGVPRQPAEAARLYESAARQGLALAQHNLGLLHYRGEELPRNEAVGLGWLNLAAKSGFQPALDALSAIVKGGGPPALLSAQPTPAVSAAAALAQPVGDAAPVHDSAQAVAPDDWSLRDLVGRLLGWAVEAPPSADAGFRHEQRGEPDPEREAQYWAALAAYHMGDVATARRGWLQLAEQGSAEAQFRLAQSHLRSDLPNAVRVEGLYWLLKAQAQGHGEAAAALARLPEAGDTDLAAARQRLRGTGQ
ncbi:MAG: sel1 repeat family protein [Alphaproteobacteria bacterium]|nr:sel1 repeat family protein [Alphaproteobacteria bacterium]